MPDKDFGENTVLQNIAENLKSFHLGNFQQKYIAHKEPVMLY